MTFAMGMGGGLNTDATDTHGAIFAAFGGTLIDAEGKSQLQSDGTRQALEYAQRLVKFYPADAVSYDDASNNRALISGKSALIFNPPSAWAVAKRDDIAVAVGLLDLPGAVRSQGPLCADAKLFLGRLQFQQNKSAAKDLLEFLMQRDNVEARDIASDGYDLPPYAKLNDFKIWEEVGPPKGTVFNYPIRPSSGRSRP